MTVSQVCRQWSLCPLVGAWWIEEPFPRLPLRPHPGSPTLLLTTRLRERRATHQRLTGVRPTIRVRVHRIVTLQILQQTLLEIRWRTEVATLQETTRQHAEPQLHLVQPGTMLGREMKHMLVLRIRQERTPLLARLEQTRLEGHIAQGRDVFADFQTPVRVQIVQHPVELLELPEMQGHMADVVGEIRTGARL